jgi:hypothetical protein
MKSENAWVNFVSRKATLLLLIDLFVLLKLEWADQLTVKSTLYKEGKKRLKFGTFSYVWEIMVF